MSDRLARARALFCEALEKETPRERAELVERACGADAALRDEVMALLRAHEEAGSFMGGAGGADERLVGTSIGRYRLLERIGEGGFGVVYVAEQTEPVRRRVALKVIREGMRTREVLARFEAERQALALMDHPCIAHVFDGGATDGGEPYFVMELVKGIPIHEYCDKCQLALRERLDLFVQVCRAVQHAHQKGVIHRDLKPGNVLVAVEDGRPLPKVIDFGVAKATGPRLTAETFHTRFAAMVGTPQYMSPEQAEMSALDIDTRSDIYSLGVLLYELLTGTTPLTRERVAQVGFDELRRIIGEEEPPTPSARLTTLNGQGGKVAHDRRTDRRRLMQAVHGDLDWIAMKALEKDRTRRYETASAFAADVERYLRHEPVEARPPSAWYRLGKLVRRNRAQAIAATLVLLALIAGVVGTTIGLVRARKAEREVRSERDEKDRARADAEDKLAIAKVLNEFLLVDLLGQADLRHQPWSQEGRDSEITVRTLLDRASATVGKRFGDQPLGEAAIRFTIGDAYLSLGLYAEGRKHLERSVELRAAKLGARDGATLESRFALAASYVFSGDYDRAEPLARDLLRDEEATAGPDDPNTMACKNLLATLYQRQRDYDRAEPLLRELLETTTARLGATDPCTLMAMANFAGALMNRSRYDDAVRLLIDALQKSEETQGLDHPDTMHVRSQLARAYKRKGRYDLAEPLRVASLELHRAKFGHDHPETLGEMNDLGLLYLAQGAREKAEGLLEHLLELSVSRLGREHEGTLRCMNNLALTYAEQGKREDAKSLYRAVLDSPTTQRRRPDHPSTLGTKANLAQLYAQGGEDHLAEPLYHEVLEASTDVLGADHRETLETRNNLAMLYVKQGKHDRAEPLLRETVEAARRTLGTDHPTTSAFIVNLTGCHEKMGQPGLSEPLYRELAEFWKSEAGEESPRYAAQLGVLGLNLVKQGKHADAEKVLRDCLRILEAKEPDAWPIFNAMSVLGASLSDQGRHAEAERLLLEGYRGMKQRESGIPEAVRALRLGEALERLVRLYEHRGDEAASAAWRAETERARK